VGLLGALANLSVQKILDYDFGSFKGYFLENFFLQELIFAGQKNIYTYKEGNSEIDFLCDFKGDITPIEVKAGINLKAKSLTVFIQKYKTKLAYRFSMALTTKQNYTVKDFPLYRAQSVIFKR
jgi:predicted AAA+ superfamily ATPase